MVSRSGQPRKAKCVCCNVRKADSRWNCARCLKQLYERVARGETTMELEIAGKRIAPAGKPGRKPLRKVRKRRATA